MKVFACLVIATLVAHVCCGGDDSVSENCPCSNDNLDIQTVLANPDKRSLCKFGKVFKECLEECDPPTAELLDEAICARCGAEKAIVSVLCLVLPLLPKFL